MSDFTLLQETFRLEATELLDELARILETQRGEAGDREAFVAARRVVHNLKGAALTVGAPRIAGPCHELEDELVAASKENALPGPERVEAWLRIVTELQGLSDDPNLVQLPSMDWPSPVGPTREGPEVAPAATAVAASATIRVETTRLDDVMSHVREVAQTQVRLTEQARVMQELHDECANRLANETANAQCLHGLGSVVRQLRQDIQEFGHLVDALSSSLNHVRMTPLSGMVALWQRTVRETANNLARPTQLEVEVGDTEVDIHLCELIKDPLLHMLRNAVVHGIEPGHIRRAAGKPPIGRLRIEAHADGAFVELRVSDDGGGVDPNRIAEKAVERGWIAATTAVTMSDAERRALVFLPGFSTAEVVTTIAGRGMGLHSVQRNIEELGGSISLPIETALGGTTFKLRIPATVLSVKGLLVRSGKVTYALPLYDVAQVAAVEPAALEQSEGHPIFRDPSGRPIRVRSLEDLLERPSIAPQAKLFLVVLRRTGQELALIVDLVLGEREFIARPMPWNLEGIAGINGALILPDGTVALSLDPTVLFAAAQQSRGRPKEATSEHRAARGRILVVDDSLAVRTLESQTLSSAGYQVTACADGLEAWRLLENRQYDLVVCDVRMPNMDGFELTTRIRASSMLQRLPVILVTGLSSPDDVARGAEVGADGYIVKGELDQEKLLQAVRRLTQ